MDKVNKQTEEINKLRDLAKGLTSMLWGLEGDEYNDFKERVRSQAAVLESRIKGLEESLETRKNQIQEKDNFEDTKQRVMQEKERLDNDRAMTETMYENNLGKVRDYQEDIDKYNEKIKDEEDSKKRLQQERKKLYDERQAYIDSFEMEDKDTFNWDKVRDYNSVIENYDKIISERDKVIEEQNRRIEQANRFMESPQSAVEMYGSYLNMIGEQTENNNKRLSELTAQNEKYEAMGRSIRDNEAEADRSIEDMQESIQKVRESIYEQRRDKKKNEYAAEYIAAVEPELKAEAKEVAEAVKIKAEERAQRRAERRAAEAGVRAQAKAAAEAAQAKVQEKAQAKAEAQAAAAEETQFTEYKERLKGSSPRVNLSDDEIRGIMAFRKGLENSLGQFQKDLDRSLATAQNPTKHNMTNVTRDVNSVSSVIEDMEQSYREELDKDKKILRDKQRLAKETRERNRREIERLEKQRDALMDDREKKGFDLMNARKSAREAENSGSFSFIVSMRQNKETKLDREYKEIKNKLEEINMQVAQKKKEMRDTLVDASNQAVKNEEKEKAINAIINPMKDKINRINGAINEKKNQMNGRTAEANENSVERNLDDIMAQRGMGPKEQGKTSVFKQPNTPSLQRQVRHA